MSAHPPPVPPANRNPKEGGQAADAGHATLPKAPNNADEQGRQGNIKQNTTHQGHQQDR